MRVSETAPDELVFVIGPGATAQARPRDIASPRPLAPRTATAGGAPPRDPPGLADEATDPDPVQRALLGARLATMPAGQASPMTDALLAQLAEDADSLPRAAIAEALKHRADAPPALIRRLAADPIRAVAEPILCCSPLLTEADLRALLAAPASPATSLAIARRAGIDQATAAALIARGEAGPIAALLGNAEAEIDDAALERLHEASRGNPAWQALLAARPRLPESLALALAESLEGEALVALAARGDLPRAVAAAMRAAIATRLASPATREESPAAASARAALLHRMALLGEALVWQAAHEGQADFVAAALSLLSGVEAAVIARIRARADAPAVAALAARAGLSEGCARAVERALAPTLLPQGPERRRPSRLGSPVALFQAR